MSQEFTFSTSIHDYLQKSKMDAAHEKSKESLNKKKHMSFKRFDASNSQNIRSGECSINFNKTGLISFSKRLCEIMKLLPGDKISLLQDDEDPKEWCLIKDDNGLPLRANKEMKGLVTGSTIWHRAITEALGIDDSCNVAFLVAKDADIVIDKKTTGFSIITAKPKINLRRKK